MNSQYLRVDIVDVIGQAFELGLKVGEGHPSNINERWDEDGNNYMITDEQLKEELRVKFAKGAIK